MFQDQLFPAHPEMSLSVSCLRAPGSNNDLALFLWHLDGKVDRLHE